MEKIAVDLFCGSGAVTYGLKSAGFRVVGAVDFDRIACATYRENHPEVKLIEEDIREVNPNSFETDLNEGLDLLVVCAPCQPFSNQNRKRSNKDHRRELVLNALKFAEHLSPKMIFFENVLGITNQSVFRKLISSLTKLGYHLTKPQQIDAADLGVPQRRQRMILFGAQNDSLLNSITNIASSKRKSVRSAIADLPVPPVGAEHAGSDLLHYSRRHAIQTIERLQHIPHDGGSRKSLPDHLKLSCHKSCNDNSFPDTYGRLKWDDVAPTLTTGCTDLTKGRYAHPVQDRAITLREAARLQSFPDHYIFKGNASQIAMQIGNAVPPAMMTTLARNMNCVLSELT